MMLYLRHPKYGLLPGLAFICLLLFSGCDDGQPKATHLFESASSDQTNIGFSNTLTEDEEINLIEYLYFYNGGGVAIGDVNNDGLLDIYFSANQEDNKLYINKGDWTFEDITDKAGVAASGAWKTGVTMVDINGDGFLDIYQCRLGKYKGIEGSNQLFINNGDLTFSEKASVYGLDFSGFSTQAAFFDYDLDGDLDAYLLNHSVHTERSYGRATLRKYDDGNAGDRLFKNDNGKFTSVTKQAGIYSSNIGYGLGVGISDVNADGWPDIYVSNDFNENDYLYINNGMDTLGLVSFTESIAQTIGHTSRFSMGNDLADYNNDGLIDIISLDMLPEDEEIIKRSAGDDSYEIYSLKLKFGYGRQFTRNALQLNNGIQGDGLPSFSEIGQLAGIHATDWSWSPLLADYDNDGYKDLFISNGIKRRPNDMDYINFLSNRDLRDGLVNNPNLSDRKLVDEMPDGAVHNYLFRNNKDLTFSDVSSQWGMTAPSLSNGAAYADLDNDGDLDLIVNNINEVASLYRNTTAESASKTKQSYLKVIPLGKGKNTFGIGAKLFAYADGKVFYQENFVSRGFQSSVSPWVHFGLGEIKTLDSLRVVWPGGKTQLLTKVEINRSIQLEETEAKLFYRAVERKERPLLIDVTDGQGIDFTHKENNFNDFNREFLIPHLVSKEGPKVAVVDFNSDGKDDFYIGNASGALSSFFVSASDSTFSTLLLPRQVDNMRMEETNCLFFDANGDGLPDLYIVSGGNEFSPRNNNLKDRLLINNGAGGFTDQSNGLPDAYQHGSVATAADIDQDGDQDLFIGGRVVPGQYGALPLSYVLLNDGTGKFTDATADIAPALGEVGMVTDAQWIDLNGDTYPELVVVGEWMPIAIYGNNKGQLTRLYFEGLAHSNGWWSALKLTDVDNDGDTDFIVGNLGANTRHKATLEFPMHLYSNDFDENGSMDQVLCYSTPQGVFTVNTKDELIKQIPSLKKNFVKHVDFAGKTVEEIFGETALNNSLHLQASTFETVWVENINNQGFKIHPLPTQAQFAPVAAIETADLNGDGHTDILLGGNSFSSSPYFGTYDASQGLVLLGDGKGKFNPVSARKSGLKVAGEIKDIKTLHFPGKLLFVIARNNDKPVIYMLNNTVENIF
ncbi:MAG: VCBS repeat-containing protein [Imperialibacter sp.]|uniref:VCBS repeat-containing protein n=1 Tax=Imperialibacter sp. TaxID=2038411 RepID=UPI0032EB0D9D